MTTEWTYERYREGRDSGNEEWRTGFRQWVDEDSERMVTWGKWYSQYEEGKRVTEGFV